jgi:Siphovirus Gp157
MTALYNISNEYLKLAETLADGDFDLATIEDTIEASGIVDEFKNKAQALEFVARGATAHDGAIDAEIARLQALKARRNAVAAGVRKYLLDNMQRTGITKIECPLFAISIQNNAPSADVYDPLSLPSKFMRQPDTPPPAPDKMAIKAALKAGEDVPGAKLTQSVRIVVK